VQLPNCLPFATILLGTFASGLTATLVSPALTSEEISWILQNSRPSVIFTAKSCLPAMQGALQKQEDKAFFDRVALFTVDVKEDAYPNHTATTPSDWKALLKTATSPRSTSTPILSPKTRTAVILWSSGTSGRSKGVLLSHHSLNFNCAALWHDADFFQGQQQRWLGYVPFYHVFGLCNIMLLAVCAGATVYTMPAFSLDGVLSTIPRQQITYLHMAPPVAVMLAKAAAVEPYAKRDEKGKNAFASVVAGVTGGAPLGHEVVVQVYHRLGFRVRLGYGLSETCSTTVQRGTSEEDMHAQVGDSGRPHWGVEVMIAQSGGDDESPVGKLPAPAAVDTEGEILIRSPGLMTAYLPPGGLSPGSVPEMSATTDAMTPDGWFRTGDVGTLNADGRLHITDRLKELIKVRAFQVAPAELEALLCSSEDVADAGVVGIHDKSEATEWPRAFVVPGSGRAAGFPQKGDLEALAQELKELVEQKTARYKWLQGGIVFVEQIPKSPSGKILRRVLRDGGVSGVEVPLYERKRRDVKL